MGSLYYNGFEKNIFSKPLLYYNVTLKIHGYFSICLMGFENELYFHYLGVRKMYVNTF